MNEERIKRIFGDNEDIIKTFAKIDAIKFDYTDEAKEMFPDGQQNVDSDVHVGVKAQDLAENPVTSAVVEKDGNDILHVNTEELTMANSAVLSEICKRIEVIEKILGIKAV